MRATKGTNSKEANVCGISEANMIGVAAGLSFSKHDVWVYSIAPFIYARPFEQIRNDISYHNCSITIISSGAGFSYGPLGMTHHCIQDIGYMSAIPNASILTPSNEYEMEEIFEIDCGLKYIRIDKSQLAFTPVHSKSNQFYKCYFINFRYLKKKD